ncbi:MAG TPA: DUF433 domain-containing protein [Parafilimonas sp.]|nr:DUF433 domain-containing protein [Parafilimonas sp.]
MSKYITIDKEVLGGTPVFKNTRVAVKTLFDYLEDESLDEFLKGYPSITREQAEAIIQLAAEKFLTTLKDESIAC